MQACQPARATSSHRLRQNEAVTNLKGALDSSSALYKAWSPD
jgi:RNA polymerase-interacting CarD/CdnL/TRCF family regulator